MGVRPVRSKTIEGPPAPERESPEDDSATEVNENLGPTERKRPSLSASAPATPITDEEPVIEPIVEKKKKKKKVVPGSQMSCPAVQRL